MSVATAIAARLEALPALSGWPVYLDFADADRDEGPYVVLETSETGSGDPPELVLLAASDAWCYSADPDAAATAAQAARADLDNAVLADPQREVSYVRPVYAGLEGGQDGALHWRRASFDVRAFKPVPPP